MNVGGTEKALLNLISMMPRKEYDITVLMLEKTGGFLDSIPEWVCVQEYKDYQEFKYILNNPPKMVILDLLKRFCIKKAVVLLFLYLVCYILRERSLLFQYLCSNSTSLNKEYDVAIAYAGPMDFISFFIAKKANAAKKIQWIHFDVTKIGFNKKFAQNIYNQFDQIFVVSEEGKNKLVKLLPSIHGKTKKILNILPTMEVEKKANEGEGFEDNFTGIRILTVGRLSKEKGQDLTIPVLSRLLKDGLNVRWYCIGEGKARKEYEESIRRYGVEGDFILLGTKPNPYPYMKQCDIYVQPSRHEGYCITVSEAKCFNIPIVATDFTGAREQLIHEQTGLIVDVDLSQIYEAVNQIINDRNLQRVLRENLAKESSRNKETYTIKHII